MSTLGDEFKKIEYTNTMQALLHFHRTHYDILKIYFTLYLAAWGGYVVTQKTGLEEFSPYLLVFGFLAGIFFIVILIGNRHLINVTRRRLDFLRNKFLFNETSIWESYPVSYRKKDTSDQTAQEEVRMMSPTSSFTWTVMLLCAANAILFHQILSAHLFWLCGSYIVLATFGMLVLLFAGSFLWSCLVEERS